MKRLWRQPVYIVLLVLLPILGLTVTGLEQSERGVCVAVCVEEGAWRRQITEGLQEQASDSILEFVFCRDASEVERSVLSGGADCGFVIAGEIGERVMDRDWSKTVTVYETSASSITGMAKERISVVIFRLYAEQCYEMYMRETAAGLQESDHYAAHPPGTGTDAVNENGDIDISNKMIDDFADYAWEAYEDHLMDGSTFGFRYISDDQKSQHTSDTDVISDTVVFPVKGVFAVIIFISGMCGMLEYDTDRREKRFIRLAPNMLTYIVDIWIPTVFVSVAALLCLWIVDGLILGGCAEGTGRLRGLLSVWSAGMWMEQIGRLLFYQVIVVAYCCLLGMVLKKQETIAAAIPILTIGSLVCAPVFVRLGSYVPLFAVLEKLFPVTYYLM